MTSLSSSTISVVSSCSGKGFGPKPLANGFSFANFEFVLGTASPVLYSCKAGSVSLDFILEDLGDCPGLLGESKWSSLLPEPNNGFGFLNRIGLPKLDPLLISRFELPSSTTPLLHRASSSISLLLRCRLQKNKANAPSTAAPPIAAPMITVASKASAGDGSLVGATEGDAEGEKVGASVGDAVGGVGDIVGDGVGEFVGGVGDIVGEEVGTAVGETLGT